MHFSFRYSPGKLIEESRFLKEIASELQWLRWSAEGEMHQR